ncbi:MAG: fumarylacetoacetate hydrolase family protein [Bifidobacteriaceae bacterium]|jgi:acylpyruvate hydrolase|nr:fumarylacetoacetate hydrolase family protein [Bifidobacteriaceae bacterium]
MRLATLRTGSGGGRTTAARIEDRQAVILEEFEDVGAILRQDALEAARTAAGPTEDLAEARYAPVVVKPGKIICVGMNYGPHLREMGRAAASHPTLFCKLKEALVGACEPILLPPESNQVDWEGELAVVVGRRLRRADMIEAAAAVGGYTMMCDTSMRDWQYRTSQWFQGKTWEKSTPLGPHLATPDELPPEAQIRTRLNSVEVQRGRIEDLMVSPVMLLSYVSTFVSLEPGDVVATGTPAGVGHAMTPPTYLRPGDQLEIEVDGVGILQSWVEKEAISRHD